MNDARSPSSQLVGAVEVLLGVLVPNWREDEDLAETPQRVARMYSQELCAGLTLPMPRLTTFKKPGGLDQMIVVGPMVVHSLCPHHLAPILGRAWVAVVPGESLLGLSKYSRLVRWCMARPIMQEKATELVATELGRALSDALGLAVVVRAEHLCMKWRGVREPEALTTTSSMRGVFRTDATARGELLRFIDGSVA